MWLWIPCLFGLWVGLVASSGPRSAFVERLEPRDFSSTAEYFVSTGSSALGGDLREGPAMMEDLRRGQEGLMIKLNDVTRSIKEDELKLNNIFYKLGRHDTDLEGVDSLLDRLSTSTKRIEAKLNKHAFNVDFLRRRVEEMKENIEAEQRVEVQVAATRSLINRLEDRLTDALARLGTVENTTQTLQKRSVPQYGPTLALHSRPPTLTVYPDRHTGISDLTGECRVDWEQVGDGCYWFGGEELTYTEAISYCIRHGGYLLTLAPPGSQLSLLLNRLRSDIVYWTSGTDAFNKGSWEFLMTATPVMPLHWAIEVNSTAHHNNHCAGLTPNGLIKRKCTHRLPYICHII
ncbi:C-type lectin domain family 4 member F-like isoform X1 [Macrobrachium rosenbergii]|uniref:C-type lectin domain family 4 member F-like isoform X1 n=1 Tax=Macrobrachium rosenbergii TaxID=79674 RepID=UPI0034D4B9E0